MTGLRGIVIFPGAVSQPSSNFSQAFLATFVAFQFQNIESEVPIIVSHDSKKLVQTVGNC
jgi:hypothetical protein